MFRKGLEEEFNNWLDNMEFNSEVFDKVNNLEEKWHKWQKSSMDVNMKAIKRDI